ncbi:folylpolyglutamate synthase [Colletotrichum abscissum]|uniref:tetrahydrofolate synthase n=1 Tax=Colletotrichum abscissum TaxID=1671311 RepID=A0A9Q0AUH6_9PEZI|nr:folylpolyglutamate synthase [Colletotrichum abscissum]
MSPFLDKHNEMIRIDSVPLSDTCFAEAFFEVWDGLELSIDDTGPPRQLQLLAILSYHVFLKEEVDVAIYETHHGGQYDVTNIVKYPIVTAITSIGFDHQAELGGSIENIAWHKAGIFKSGACALSVPQTPAAETVLRDRAQELGVVLEIVGTNQDMTGNFDHDTQKLNASLARKACDAFLLCKRDERLTQEDIKNGIRGFTLPGRFQVVRADGVAWCLDGAHNPMSAAISAAWFKDLSKQEGCLRDILGHSVSCVILTSDTGVLDEDRLNRYLTATPLDLMPNSPGLLEERVGVGSPEAEG